MKSLVVSFICSMAIFQCIRVHRSTRSNFYCRCVWAAGGYWISLDWTGLDWTDDQDEERSPESAVPSEQENEKRNCNKWKMCCRYNRYLSPESPTLSLCVAFWKLVRRLFPVLGSQPNLGWIRWPEPLSSVETTERVVWADIFSSRRIKRRACAERLTKKKWRCDRRPLDRPTKT